MHDRCIVHKEYESGGQDSCLSGIQEFEMFAHLMRGCMLSCDHLHDVIELGSGYTLGAFTIYFQSFCQDVLTPYPVIAEVKTIGAWSKNFILALIQFLTSAFLVSSS